MPLILTRKPGTVIRIGEDIVITVVHIRGNQARLSIEAPKDVTIHREEIYQKIQQLEKGVDDGITSEIQTGECQTD